jgi:hypothetical protein
MRPPSPRLGRQRQSPTVSPPARTHGMQPGGAPQPVPRSPYRHLFVPEEVRQVLASAPYTQLQVLRHATVPGHLPASAVSYARYLYSKKR